MITLGIAVSRKELLGLLLMFIVYVLLGGLVFMLLESPLEEQLRKEYEELRDEFRENLDRLTTSNLTREDVESLITRLATAHSNNLIDDDGNETHTHWSFENSFFFAITVVTTIGYGHLAPSTTAGRLFCLLYATFGIPLTGILLAAIGGHFSQHLVKKLQRRRRSRHSRLVLFLTGAWTLLPWLLIFLVVPAAIFVFTEGWSFVEGFYYCFITLSTIGFGDYVASNFEGQYIWLYKTCVVLWIIFGLGYLAMILNYISRAMRCKQIRRVERRLSTSIHCTQQKVGQRLEEVYQILHEISRHRPVRHRNRALKRMQSYPAPEISDRNHNHKIQRLLNLVQNLKEEEAAPRRIRRLSLPLPNHPQMAATGARGSLQVFVSTKEHEIIKNGWQKNFYDKTVQSGNPMRKDFTETILKVPGKDVIADKHALLDFEGLQCTRV